jgi:hypothetical protein
MASLLTTKAQPVLPAPLPPDNAQRSFLQLKPKLVKNRLWGVR